MQLLQTLSLAVFLPHGTCYLWNPRILWLHVISDSVITLSYYSIPFALVHLVRKRRDIPFSGIFWLFAFFILGCGTTHLMEVWTIWHPDYFLSGIIKAATASISLITAFMLIPLIPKAAALPSPAQMHRANQDLQDQIAVRAQRERELTTLTAELEERIQKRTAELESINQSLEKEIALGIETQKALGASQARLSSVIESAMDAILTVDDHQRIILFNHAAEKMFGLKAKDVIGQSLDMFIPERYRAAHPQHIRRFGETGTTSRKMGAMGQLWALRADGTEFPIEASISQTEAGGRKLFAVILRDVTERKRIEDALNASEERLRVLLDGVSDYAIYMLDPEGNVLSWNEGAARLKGYRAEEIIGKNFSCFYTAEEQQTNVPKQQLDRARSSGRVEQQAMRVRKNGSTFWAYKIIIPLFNQDKTLRGFSVVARDITERRRDEEALRERNQALELAPVIIRGFDGSILMWNQACESLYGYSKAEAIGAKSHDLLRTSFPEPLSNIEDHLRSKGRWEGELVHLRKDGTQIIVSSQWALYQDRENWPVRVVETNTDITARRQAERQVRELNQELEKRVDQRTSELQATNKELEAFTYSVSHDLRAPLRHIAGFSNMLAEQCSESLPTEARHYLQRIQDGIRRMGQLVDDLLSLTRIGRHEVRTQVTGIESVVKDVIAELAPDLEKREVEWKIGELPYVEADPALLRVVFQNLLANAVKYTRPRQKAVIEVGKTEIDGQQVMFVRDNGVGFNMKYADKLFGVFQRLHRSEDFEGTGVGLATVQRVVQKHGGRIWADAELDKGATFYFTVNAAARKIPEKQVALAGGAL